MASEARYGVDERHNRTWLCSVVFTDIVCYSRQPVERQLELKGRLEGYIAHCVSRVAAENRIIVDTGDGAALCFLGDPEEALIASLGLRDVLRDAGHTSESGLQVRIGVNLGPIKVVKSLDGQLSPLGDGINKAQRIMSFAQPNQVLVSRSFYDVIACLSEEYARLFRYLGMRRDKHDLEHPVYEVVVPGEIDTETRVLLTRVVETESSREVALATGWDPAVLEQVSAELAGHIGPLARVLVKKAMKRASNMEDLRSLLADSIPLEESRRQFLGGGRAGAKESKPQNATAVEDDILTIGRGASQSATDVSALAEIEGCLSTALGPVAHVLFRRYAARTGDLDLLCRQLAEEIDRADQRQHFLGAVDRYLKQS